MDLTLDDGARDLLGQAGFDPVYGARPLKRAIQRYIVDPLAKDIIAGKFAPGDKIRATRIDDHLVFKKATGAGKEAA